MSKLTLSFVAVMLLEATTASTLLGSALAGPAPETASRSCQALVALSVDATALPARVSRQLQTDAPARQQQKKAQSAAKESAHAPTGRDPEKVSLPALAREAIAIHFQSSRYASLQELIDATPVCKEYQQPRGLFVTLSRGGRTRACWGAVYPKGMNQVEATVATTEAALSKEYRYPRVKESEWPGLTAQVTVIRDLEPLGSISEQNALQYGLLVRQGGRGAVLLPGEASDAHYQLIKCKLKAGIPVEQPCQIYRIRADVHK